MPNPPMLATVRRLVAAMAILGLAVVSPPRDAAGADPESRGEKVYRQKCASCHGASGEGSEDCERPLSGDRSAAQLAKLIARTMPEDDPGTCVGEEAEAVATYLYDRFYSREAQARAKPPRVELSRLTVRQYRNAVADVIGGFRWEGKTDGRLGLKAVYTKSPDPWNERRKAFERIDPEVRFDFGDGPPPGEGFHPNRFAIRWQGSVFAPETGEYEFIARTDQGVKLWVNDVNAKQPLIDAWVKSGDDTEHRGTVWLLGGRYYPLKLLFSKGKQGVDDSKNEKGKPPAIKASISLEWKLPHRPAEVIPARCLSPVDFPETFVVEAAFPPDDRSTGYERGTTISKAWEQATTDAAIEAADYVAAHLRELANAKPDDADREAKLRKFCRDFARRAFRRPLSDEQAQTFVDRHFGNGRDPETSVKRAVLLVLKSPRFLYREVGGSSPDAYDVASRVSFGLWDSLPDNELLQAAESGQLGSREQVLRQAERMAGDLRARGKLREFFLKWLRVEQVPDVAKDPERFPGFDAAIASDLRTSLDLFLDDVLWGEASDYRQLLLADSVYLNGRLAKFYGVDLPADAPFRKTPLDPADRSGVLTHPYLMATFAYTGNSSPIHRGVFVARSVLGRGLKPPPEAVAPLAPDLHAGLTTRERVALQTSPASCVTCHGMINPLGFGLEHFDAVGRYRKEEKGKPIDATGAYDPPSGETKPYTGARELGTLLAASEEAHTAFVEQLFHHLVKQPIRAYGPGKAQDLRRSFADHQFHVRKLMAEIVADSALTSPAAKP